MLSAAEVREKISANDNAFEKDAQVIAKYLVNCIAAKAVDEMVEQRRRKIKREYPLEAYRPAFERIGKGHLKSRMEHDEWNTLTDRAREIANARLRKMGYKGNGFYDDSRGDPIYGGGSGMYYVLVLELAV